MRKHKDRHAFSIRFSVECHAFSAETAHRSIEEHALSAGFACRCIERHGLFQLKMHVVL